MEINIEASLSDTRISANQEELELMGNGRVLVLSFASLLGRTAALVLSAVQHDKADESECGWDEVSAAFLQGAKLATHETVVVNRSKFPGADSGNPG